MPLGHLENFHLEKSPYLLWTSTQIFNGATPLTVRADGPMVAVNGTVSEAYCEPQQCRTSGNEGHILDNLTRMIVMMGRDGGSGDWEADIKIGREGETLSILVGSLDLPHFDSAAFLAYDGILPADLCKVAASPALDDEVLMEIDIRPDVNTISYGHFVVMLVPGFVAGDSNKGANLSAPQYLVNR